MRFFTSAICTAVGVGLLAGCAGMSGQSGSVPSVTTQSRVARAASRVPQSLVSPWMLGAGVGRLHLAIGLRPDKKASKGGLYGSEFYSNASDGEGLINGYPNPDKKNVKPSCSISGYAINGWGIDPSGNLILPSSTESDAEPSVNIYSGPGMCGKLLASLTDSTGQAADAVSFDATKDPIYIGELTDTSTGTGDIVICTVKSGGCEAPITNSAITGNGAGVAADAKGDCWLSAGTDTNTGFVLVYWKGCKGKGAVATGTKNAGFGGLFFDAKGNLVSVDVTGALYVYSGCDPKCKVVSSSTLKGASLFGNLNSKGNQLAVADIGNSTIDVYTYAPTGVKYLYSFDNGLDGTDYIIGGGFNPTLKTE